MASLSEVISPVSDNPTGDRANMVNNTPIIVAGETSIKSPPTFTGSGFSDMEDPLKFLEDFKEAAIWNNWVLDSRKKELFYRCLKGHAKDWYVGEIMEMPNYSGLAFDAPRNESSVVSRFKKKFVTPRWYLKYEERFDERVQGVNEPVSQYVCAKRALYHKANYNKGLDKTEKQLVQDVRKGLLPVLKKACWDWENSPYSPEQ
ncbi:hypothetical protein G6F33_012611 [Rhizopus arrhizus]|nr:hypothetical protein G6F33_012611 [Rhizopus arrhizus]